MVKRYNGIEADPDGVYVMFEDYERLTAEVSRMDKRTRHLLDRIEDAEAALLIRDPAYQDEYWKRYPESERGKTTGERNLAEEIERGLKEIRDNPGRCPCCGVDVCGETQRENIAIAAVKTPEQNDE